jgi:hypothetical protein
MWIGDQLSHEDPFFAYNLANDREVTGNVPKKLSL